MKLKNPQQHNQRRLDIIHHGAKLFRKKGYHGVTVDDIARSLGISKVSIYQYVDSKEEILYEIHDLATQALLENLKLIVAKDMPPSEKLAEAIANHISLVCSEMSFATAALQEEYALRRIKKRKLIAKRDEYDRIFREIINEGIDAGEFIECDSKLVSFAIIGAANYTPHWYMSKGLKSKDEIIEGFVRYLMRGLCVDR